MASNASRLGWLYPTAPSVPVDIKCPALIVKYLALVTPSHTTSDPSRLDPLLVCFGWITVVSHCPLLGLSMPVDVKYLTLIVPPVLHKTLTEAACLAKPRQPLHVH